VSAHINGSLIRLREKLVELEGAVDRTADFWRTERCDLTGGTVHAAPPGPRFQDQEWHTPPSAILTGTLSSTPVRVLEVSKYSFLNQAFSVRL
jgi:hypothetical protein